MNQRREFPSKQSTLRGEDVSDVEITIEHVRARCVRVKYGDNLDGPSPGRYRTDPAFFLMNSEALRVLLPVLGNPFSLPWSVEVKFGSATETETDLIVGIHKILGVDVGREILGWSDQIPIVIVVHFDQLYWGHDRKTINAAPITAIERPVK